MKKKQRISGIVNHGMILDYKILEESMILDEHDTR